MKNETIFDAHHSVYFSKAHKFTLEKNVYWSKTSLFSCF